MTASVRGSGGGRRIFLPRALVDVFEKNGKKNKTTSMYRLSINININHKGLQRTANEYAVKRRIYKDLISNILNSASRILQC